MWDWYTSKVYQSYATIPCTVGTILLKSKFFKLVGKTDMTVIDRHLRNKKNSLRKSLNRIAQSFVATVLLLSPALRLNAQTELSPDVAIQEVYNGIISLYGSQAVPNLYYPVVPGSIASSCGLVNTSSYCPQDHTIFITTDHIDIAYEYGDAALAYILGHEYAHAMQNAFKFKPALTPISELQADCLAGLYLGLITNIYFDASDVEEIRSLAYRFGDYDTWAEQHHGTPQQRMDAVSIGINASLAGIDGASQCMI